MQLRPYQLEAIEALHTHVCSKESNPCIVLPTGSGKSVVMAGTIAKWSEEASCVRGCVLAHRRELVEQNAVKLRAIYPTCDIGIFAAGLGRRDYDSSILFASIDSIYKKAGDFQPFDFLFVDEAHRIPPAGEGKYRTFINECRKFNKNMRVVGWTATPYRMGCGSICHSDHILNEVCYEAKITDLIQQGYLCNLRSKVGECQPDLKDVKRNSGGDYITQSLAEATNRANVVQSAVAESVRIIESEKRRAAVFFCVDIEHCEAVSKELSRYGIHAPYLTGKTKSHVREKLISDFKDGLVKAVCNVNVLTEGFDAPHIDTIVLLRPTLSPGLFSQMVGRGLRLHQSKTYCLVLDFANCIDEHGPIDLLGSDCKVVMATCQECRESFSKAIRKCPSCGWEIPKQEVERLERVEAERRMHGAKASNRSILSLEPETYKVDNVMISRHCKPGSTDSLRVQYRCGLSTFREWVTLDHEGYAGHKAQNWMRTRFGGKDKVSVNEVLGNMFAAQQILDWTKTITVKRNGKHYEVIDYNKEVTL
jgi:DNA repair protein RadD